jgi:STE24 endopeptidase
MITAFVLVTVIGYFILDTVAKILNQRTLSAKVPPEFVDVYDEERYRRSQEYTLVNSRFDILSSTFNLLVLLGFWGFGGFELFDQWLRQFHLPEFVTGLCYVFGICIAHELLFLPFQVYRTFVIEQRFGFNRSTVRTFISDQLKEWILGGLLLGLFLGLILWLFEKFGGHAYLIAWAITAGLSVLLMYLAPKLILPIFYQLTSLPEGELRTEIFTFCKKQSFPIQDLFVIDGSRRSSKANAFFTGFGRNKRIALFDTLIQNHTVPELVAVLAHEIGHFKKGHIIKHFIFMQLNLFLIFLAASFCLTQPAVFTAFKVTHPSYYVGMVLCMILMQPVTILLGVLGHYWSRKHEFEADRFAAVSMGESGPLISALKKLSKDNLSNLTPHPLLVGLHFSHPPVSKRIRELRSHNG